MEKETPSEIANLEKLQSILDEIKEKGDLTGAILSYGDDELIVENLNKEFDSKTFSAMCASIIGGAEGLGQTIGDRVFRKIITELEDYTMIMMGCGKQASLALIIPKTSTGGTIIDNLEEYCNKIKALI